VSTDARVGNQIISSTPSPHARRQPETAPANPRAGDGDRYFHRLDDDDELESHAIVMSLGAAHAHLCIRGVDWSGVLELWRQYGFPRRGMSPSSTTLSCVARARATIQVGSLSTSPASLYIQQTRGHSKRPLADMRWLPQPHALVPIVPQCRNKLESRNCLALMPCKPWPVLQGCTWAWTGSRSRRNVSAAALRPWFSPVQTMSNTHTSSPCRPAARNLKNASKIVNQRGNLKSLK